jgi:hypothetical protein
MPSLHTPPRRISDDLTTLQDLLLTVIQDFYVIFVFNSRFLLSNQTWLSLRNLLLIHLQNSAQGNSVNESAVNFVGTVLLSASASIEMLRRGGLPFGQVAK